MVILALLIGILVGGQHVIAQEISYPRVAPNKDYDDCLRKKSKNGKLTQSTFKVCKKHLAAMKDGQGLTSGEILSVIRFHLNDIRRCYETTLKNKPGIQGKLSTKFVIGPTGKIKSVEPSTKAEDMKDESLLVCVRKTISAWQFQRPRGNEDVTVNYPFTFTPI